MTFRLLLLASLPVIAAALAARWFFGQRVLESSGAEICSVDPRKWPEKTIGNPLSRTDDTAAQHGGRMHAAALAEWAREQPAAAGSRENSLRFGIIAPPFAAVIAILAVFAGKLHALVAIGVFLAGIALAALLGLLSLPAELQAVNRTAERMRAAGAFVSTIDLAHIVRCAHALAWMRSLPQILRVFQRR